MSAAETACSPPLGNGRVLKSIKKESEWEWEAIRNESLHSAQLSLRFSIEKGFSERVGGTCIKTEKIKLTYTVIQIYDDLKLS